MEQEFISMRSFWAQRLAEKPRGFDLFNHELMSHMIRAFDEQVKTVYVSGYAFPTELLWAFDVAPFDFEIACNNLPAAFGGQGSTLMKDAENQGYSRDICSFDRLIIACQLRGEMPPGDLYLTSSYYCHAKAKANETVAAAAGRESIIFDVPNETSPAAVKYVAGQLRDIAARLEVVTGQKLDLDRLKEAIRSSNRARASMVELNELMKHKPCPWDGVRACLLSLAGAIFWGSPVLEKVYDLLVKEVQARVQKGAGLSESHRILWYPWVPVQQSIVFSMLKEKKVSLPMVEAAQVWWSALDDERPFEALAGKALENYMVGPIEPRLRRLLKLVEDYQVDGVIHFSTPACHHENAAYRFISDALKAKGLPILNLEGDMTDERNFSQQKAGERLTTFLEVLDHNVH